MYSIKFRNRKETMAHTRPVIEGPKDLETFAITGFFLNDRNDFKVGINTAPVSKLCWHPGTSLVLFLANGHDRGRAFAASRGTRRLPEVLRVEGVHEHFEPAEIASVDAFDELGLWLILRSAVEVGYFLLLGFHVGFLVASWSDYICSWKSDSCFNFGNYLRISCNFLCRLVVWP